jgi:hypothetical protein
MAAIFGSQREAVRLPAGVGIFRIPPGNRVFTGSDCWRTFEGTTLE